MEIFKNAIRKKPQMFTNNSFNNNSFTTEKPKSDVHVSCEREQSEMTIW